MINKLTRIIETTHSDGTQVSRPPNNIEIMNKINEIIDYVNKNAEQKNPFTSVRSK